MVSIGVIYPPRNTRVFQNYQPESKKSPTRCAYIGRRVTDGLLTDTQKGASAVLIQEKANRGEARATGGAYICTYILPIFFLILERGCFTECFTAGLPAATHWGTSGGHPATSRNPLGDQQGRNPPKKKPRQSGGDHRGSGGRGWGICIYIPRRAYNPIVLSRLGFVKGCG